MSGKWLVAVFFSLGSFLIIGILSSHAQEPPRNLALIYTNNINAEIDPCPS
jgi:hypothetical protein